jgi:hypothetical protein
MAVVLATAALRAAPLLSCSPLAQRITITPGNLQPGGLGVHGPLANDSYVLAAGISDGIYDT